MNSRYPQIIAAIVAGLLLAGTAPVHGEEPYAVPLQNSTFREAGPSGVPEGWSKYGGGGVDQKLEITSISDDKTALLIADGDRNKEIGVLQSVAVKGDETYRVAAKVRGIKEASTSGSYLQLRMEMGSGTILAADWTRKETTC